MQLSSSASSAGEAPLPISVPLTSRRARVFAQGPVADLPLRTIRGTEALLKGVVVEAERPVGRVRVAMSQRTPGLHAIGVVPARVDAGSVAQTHERRQARPGQARGEDEPQAGDPRQCFHHRVVPHGGAAWHDPASRPPSRRSRIFARTTRGMQWPRRGTSSGTIPATPAQGRATASVERRPRPMAVERILWLSSGRAYTGGRRNTSRPEVPGYRAQDH